jgi:hypothetical protein
MSFLKRHSSINYTYTINGFSVNSVGSKKVLGVIFIVNLKFHSYIETICCKAIKTLGFIISTSKEFVFTEIFKFHLWSDPL